MLLVVKDAAWFDLFEKLPKEWERRVPRPRAQNGKGATAHGADHRVLGTHAKTRLLNNIFHSNLLHQVTDRNIFTRVGRDVR